MTPLFLLALLAQIDPAAEIATLGDRAASAYEAGEYESALVLYQRSQALLIELPGRRSELGVASFLIASCLDKLERFAEALQVYRSAAELPLPAELRERVDRKIEEMQVALRGRVELRCEWAYARVRVDDGPERGCTEAFVLDAGPHRIFATQPDGTTTTHAIDVRARSTSSLEVPRHDPIVAPPSVPEIDRTWTWATTIGAAALVAGGVAAVGVGRLELERANRAYARANDEALSNEARLLARDETLAADGRTDRATIAGWITGGLGVALGVVAAILWAGDFDSAPSAVRW